MIDEIYKFEEPVNLGGQHDLNLSKINIYMHQLLNHTRLKLFRVRLSYGNIA